MSLRWVNPGYTSQVCQPWVYLSGVLFPVMLLRCVIPRYAPKVCYSSFLLPWWGLFLPPAPMVGVPPAVPMVGIPPVVHMGE